MDGLDELLEQVRKEAIRLQESGEAEKNIYPQLYYKNQEPWAIRHAALALLQVILGRRSQAEWLLSLGVDTKPNP